MPRYGEKRYQVINQSRPRTDGWEKVTGKARYAGDIQLPGMLYGAALRSPYSSAEIVKIDTEKAKAIPGVEAVLTARDVEKSASWAGHLYLADKIYFSGNVVAVVAAQTRELAQQALAAIEVEYKELPGVYSIEDAIAAQYAVHAETPDNIYPGSHHTIRKGDVEVGFTQADVIIERTYQTQFVEHAYIELESVVAYTNPADGVMTVHSASQNPYFTRRYVADMLCVPLNQVRVIQETLGGSFGGKEEGAGLCAARAAYLSRRTGKPVKLINSREESILESAKRHPFQLTYKVGATKDGKIVAWQGMQIANGGAFSNQTPYMNWRANAHSAGAYDIPNISTDTYGVYTNTLIGGAFRGFSSPQLLYAQEQIIDELAEALGMSEVDVRRINCLKDGSQTATGTEVNNVVLSEMIEDSLQETDYQNKRAAYQAQTDSQLRRGIGMAIAHRSCGFGAEAPDASGAMVILNEDGTAQIQSGLAENGQGLKTAYCMIAAEALGIAYENVRFVNGDTHVTADCGMTVASRGTVMGAQPVKKAAKRLNAIMRKNAIELGFFADIKKLEAVCGIPAGALDGVAPLTAEDIVLELGFFFAKAYPAYRVRIADVCNASLWTGKQLAVYEWFIPDACPQDHETGQGRAAPTYSYACVIAEVEVDMETGFVDVKKVTASHDVGTAINPALIEGQVYGGILMGQGYGIMEEVELKAGRVLNQNLDEYILPTALDMPEMQIHLYECSDPAGTYGAKSVGEPATEAVAAAIANAVYSATGRRIRENPASLERVLLGKKLR